MNASPLVPRLRLALFLWVAGMLGAIMFTAEVLPRLLERFTLPWPLPLMLLASLHAKCGAFGAGEGLACRSGVGSPCRHRLSKPRSQLNRSHVHCSRRSSLVYWPARAAQFCDDCPRNRTPRSVFSIATLNPSIVALFVVIV